MSLHILNLHCLLSSKQLGDKMYLLSIFFFLSSVLYHANPFHLRRVVTGRARGRGKPQLLSRGTSSARSTPAPVAASPAGFQCPLLDSLVKGNTRTVKETSGSILDTDNETQMFMRTRIFK